jgi:hypothetical protein
VQALQKKQRSGIVAPPTPGRSSTPPLISGRSIEVPDFTPLPRRAPPRRKPRPTRPHRATDPPINAADRPNLPPSLLGPRYSHLLEEAIAGGESSAHGTALPSTPSVPSRPVIGQPSADLVYPTPQSELPPFVEPAKSRAQPSTSIRKRVKGFIFSYLPSAPTQVKQSLQTQPQRLRLPVPPPEVLEKSRGPISTPIRPPAPRPTHPKELVHLQPAPPPQRSLIPRVLKPQRLVELHPLPPPVELPPVHVPRSRCSSGGSVKDLVRSFEELDGCSSMGKDTQKRVEIWRARSTGVGQGLKEGGGKPMWKP